MAANVETMMYSGEVPWHGLGQYVGDHPILADEAIRAAGLDWHVDLRPMLVAHAQIGDACPRCGEGEVIRGKTRLGCSAWRSGCTWTENDLAAPTPVPDAFAVVRDSDRRVLGTVGKRYRPLQNAEAFGFLDAVAGPENLVRYHTAGSLGGGRKVWLLAELVGLTIEPVPGDATVPYILLANGHDGRLAVTATTTSVRVVCQNTLNLALRDSTSKLSIRHTGDVLGRLDEARRVLGLAREAVEVYNDDARLLAHRDLGDRVFAEALATLIPLPENGNATRAEKVHAEILRLREEGPGADLPGVRGTAWGALQAITAYTTHARGTRGRDANEARLDASWFGTGDDLNQRARFALLDLVA